MHGLCVFLSDLILQPDILKEVFNIWDNLPHIVKLNIYIFGSAFLLNIFLEIVVKPIGFLVIYIQYLFEYLNDIKDLKKSDDI